MTEKRLALLLASAALASAASPAATDSVPITGKASGLRFSGNFDDDAGRRSWLAEADTAASGAKPGEWRLERIRITTFDREKGLPRLRIIAPAATYLDKENAAADPGPVVMEGDNGALRLTGRDWRWTDARNAGYTFAIHDAVRVTLAPVAQTGGRPTPPTVITADRLDATNTRDERRLAFSGRVRIESRDTAGNEVVMTCDRLVAHLPPSKDVAAPGARTEIFDRIEADGRVRLEDRGAVITGARGLVLPGTAGRPSYTVSGDALFTVNGGDLRVNGETMRFDSATHRIEVDPPAGVPDGRVAAAFRSVEALRTGASGAGARATASGKKLSILIGTDTGTLLFTGDVRLDDPVYAGTCDRLAVDFVFDHRKRMPSLDGDGGSVRHVVADGAVSLTRKDPGRTGRTVTAGRAEFFPERGRTVLTVRPKAYDPENGLVLDAAKVTLDNDRDTDTGRLVAESDATTPVRATFDATGTTDTSRLAKLPPHMTVESALLVGESVVAPGPSKTRIGKFRFEGGVKLDGIGVAGECDRLGIEVSPPPVRTGKAASRIRHAVATGNVRLDLDRNKKSGVAKAGRAELWPEANIRELAPSSADGLDGESPLYVTLERDDSSPGLRPSVTVTGFVVSGIAGALSPENKDTRDDPTVVTADHEELVVGEKRLRAFARNNVVFTASGVSGTSSTLEMLATAKRPKTGKTDAKADPAFSPDAIIARTDVKLAIESGNKTVHATADTLEIYPGPDGDGTLALDGHPSVNAMITPPEVTRKTFRWKRVPGAGGKSALAYEWRDEVAQGASRQILRPRITLPPERAPDIARPVGDAVKNLDNDR